MISRLLSYFLGVDKDHDDYRYLSMVFFSIVLATVTTGYFLAFNIYWGRNITLISIEAFCVLMGLLSLYLMLKMRMVKSAAFLLLCNTMLVCFAVMYLLNTKSFSLLLVLVCPVLSIFLTGIRTGSIFNILYFAAFVWLYLSYSSTWQPASYTPLAFMQTSIIYVIFFVITAFYEAIRIKNQGRLEEANRQLAEMAYRDPLTHLHNRRYLEDMFLKQSNITYLAIIDIDNFKTINDQYGHQCGDDVLKHIAQCLEDNIQGKEVIARWGGEEFIFISQEKDRKRFIEKLEQLRSDIALCDVGIAHPITVSIGGAKYEARHHRLSVLKADDALYKAKSSAKNCVQFAD